MFPAALQKTIDIADGTLFPEIANRLIQVRHSPSLRVKFIAQILAIRRELEGSISPSAWGLLRLWFGTAEQDCVREARPQFGGTFDAEDMTGSCDFSLRRPVAGACPRSRGGCDDRQTPDVCVDLSSGRR
jgi:hypothetical protein